MIVSTKEMRVVAALIDKHTISRNYVPDVCLWTTDEGLAVTAQAPGMTLLAMVPITVPDDTPLLPVSTAADLFVGTLRHAKGSDTITITGSEGALKVTVKGQMTRTTTMPYTDADVPPIVPDLMSWVMPPHTTVIEMPPLTAAVLPFVSRAEFATAVSNVAIIRAAGRWLAVGTDLTAIAVTGDLSALPHVDRDSDMWLINKEAVQLWHILTGASVACSERHVLVRGTIGEGWLAAAIAAPAIGAPREGLANAFKHIRTVTGDTLDTAHADALVSAEQWSAFMGSIDADQQAMVALDPARSAITYDSHLYGQDTRYHAAIDGDVRQQRTLHMSGSVMNKVAGGVEGEAVALFVSEQPAAVVALSNDLLVMALGLVMPS